MVDWALQKQLPAYLSIYLPACLPTYLFYLSTFPTYLPTYLHACLPNYRHIYLPFLSTYLPYLPTYLPTFPTPPRWPCG